VAPLPIMCNPLNSAWEPRAEDNHMYVYECIVQTIYLNRSTYVPSMCLLPFSLPISLLEFELE
jgi:hypothetical protein